MTRNPRRRGAPLCGTVADGIACPLRRAASSMPESERLVGYGFRFWMHGYRTGEEGPWATAWSLYCGMFGPARGGMAVGALSDWVASIAAGSGRTIEIADDRCPEFCRDECLAISMIAACQHATCPALRACAYALVEDRQVEAARLDRITAHAQVFADTLAALDQVLAPSSIMTEPADEDRRDTRPS